MNAAPLPPGYNIALIYTILGPGGSRHATPHDAWRHWSEQQPAPDEHAAHEVAPHAPTTTLCERDVAHEEDAAAITPGTPTAHTCVMNDTSIEDDRLLSAAPSKMGVDEELAANELVTLSVGRSFVMHNVVPSMRPSLVDTLLDGYGMSQYKDTFFSKGITDIIEHVSKLTKQKLHTIGIPKRDADTFLKLIASDGYMCKASINSYVSIYWAGDDRHYRGTLVKRGLRTSTIKYDDGEVHEEPNQIICISKLPRPGMCGTPGCIHQDRHKGACILEVRPRLRSGA